MLDPILQCRENFGAAPREFSFWDRLTYYRVGRPVWFWLSPNDQLKLLYQHLPKLYATGAVVWGHVIQANQMMFEDGSVNCPGELVYSLQDPNIDPKYLVGVASRLFALKGNHPDDPELDGISAYLTDEMIRVFGLPVPPKISPDAPCQISTTLFVRKHLPSRRLCSGLLPIIVNPEAPQIVLPLPARFWPPQLVGWWTE